MSVVYVIYKWKNYQKENDADVLGAYRHINTARKELQRLAQEYAREYDGVIAGENDLYIVIRGGSNRQFFKIKKISIIES